MPASLRITQRNSGPQVRQFSVFLRNKVGALLEVVKLIETDMVAVLALSIQDSSEFSIVRMVVSDPDRVSNVFRREGIPFSDCEVLVVELSESAVDLGRALSALLMAEVNILFSYPLLVRPHGRSALVMHVDDNDCASSVLAGQRFLLLTQADLSR